MSRGIAQLLSCSPCKSLSATMVAQDAQLMLACVPLPAVRIVGNKCNKQS